ncbi:MAG: flagellar hook-length control protein FliK [Tateyamaria sp.]
MERNVNLFPSTDLIVTPEGGIARRGFAREPAPLTGGFEEHVLANQTEHAADDIMDPVEHPADSAELHFDSIPERYKDASNGKTTPATVEVSEPPDDVPKVSNATTNDAVEHVGNSTPPESDTAGPLQQWRSPMSALVQGLSVSETGDEMTVQSLTLGHVKHAFNLNGRAENDATVVLSRQGTQASPFVSNSALPADQPVPSTVAQHAEQPATKTQIVPMNSKPGTATQFDTAASHSKPQPVAAQPMVEGVEQKPNPFHTHGHTQDNDAPSHTVHGTTSTQLKPTGEINPKPADTARLPVGNVRAPDGVPSTTPITREPSSNPQPDIVATIAAKPNRSEIAVKTPVPSAPPPTIPVQSGDPVSTTEQLQPVVEVVWDTRPTQQNGGLPSALQVQRPELPPQVAHSIAEAMKTSPERQIEITLRPVELGTVRMTMVPQDNGMSVLITAERGETLDLMRRNIDDLNRALSDLGFEDLSFAFDQSGAHADGADPDPTSEPDIVDIEDDSPVATIRTVTMRPVTDRIAGTGIDMRM